MPNLKKTAAQYEAEAVRFPAPYAHLKKPCLLHKTEYVSRSVYQLRYGEIGDRKIFVCHRCDDGRCIEDTHLFLGTTTDNQRDCIAKGRHINQNINSEQLAKRSAAISLSNTGKKATEETKAKMSAARKGLPAHPNMIEAARKRMIENNPILKPENKEACRQGLINYWKRKKGLL